MQDWLEIQSIQQSENLKLFRWILFLNNTISLSPKLLKYYHPLTTTAVRTHSDTNTSVNGKLQFTSPTDKCFANTGECVIVMKWWHMMWSTQYRSSFLFCFYHLFTEITNLEWWLPVDDRLLGSTSSSHHFSKSKRPEAITASKVYRLNMMF